MVKKKTLVFMFVAFLAVTVTILVFLWNKGIYIGTPVIGKPERLIKQVEVVGVSPQLTSHEERDVEYAGNEVYAAQFDYGSFKRPRRRRHRRRRRNRRRQAATFLGHLNNMTTIATNAIDSDSILDHHSFVKFPHYFIVGFAKTGTKAVYEVLKLHNQLSGPKKEMRYFTKQKYSYNSASYLAHFPSPPKNGYTIEKSPDYILSTVAAVRLKQAALSSNLNTSLDIKFIVVLRNPVVRAVSDYLEMQVWSILNKRPKLSSFPNTILTSQGAVNGSVSLINSSVYIYHLNQWLQFFRLEQFCFVNGDEFITNPYREIKSLEKCLKLNSFFTENNFVFNRNKGFYCFRTSGKTLCLNRTKGRPHPRVDESLIKHLKEYFQPYNEKLYSFIGRNFDWENSMNY